MFTYLVMKRGHKLGHTPLVYGAAYSAKQLKVPDAALDVLVARGVLRRLRHEPVVEPAEEPVTETVGEAPVSGVASAKAGKKEKRTGQQAAKGQAE